MLHRGCGRPDEVREQLRKLHQRLHLRLRGGTPGPAWLGEAMGKRDAPYFETPKNAKLGDSFGF